MAKPSISLVKVWDYVDGTDVYSIHSGTAVFEDDYYKVTLSNGKPKYFYGETAWSDAQRYAYDAEMKAIYK